MTRKTIIATIVAILLIGLPAFGAAGDILIGNIEPGIKSGQVFSVAAPPDAKKVTAIFPFGLIKELRLDEIRGHWSARLIVFRQIPVGVYTVVIETERINGCLHWKAVRYCVDVESPEFEVHAPQATYGGEMLPVEVDPFEGAAKVFAYFPGDPKKLMSFSLDPNRGTYKAMIQIPEQFESEKIIIRIVVRDLENNRMVRDIEVHDLDLLEEYGIQGRDGSGNAWIL
jgi:hypothetical protein